VLSVTSGFSTNLTPHVTTVTYAYDALNRVTDRTDGAGSDQARRTHTVYDPSGNVLSVETGLSDNSNYAHSSVTSYAYDASTRRTATYEGWQQDSTTSAISYGRLTTYAYDAVGNLIGVAAGMSSDPSLSPPTLTAYVYDSLNRQTEVLQDV